MILTSVNIGTARPTTVGSVGHTGIYKEPAESSVLVTELGLNGDDVCDTSCHGGPDQAVYVYTQPDYQWWGLQIGRDMAPGTFGENLTISDLASSKLFVGDRLLLETVVLEITSPRIPCSTLAAKMEDPTFVKKFRNGERPGFYCRVIKSGSVKPGETFRYEPAAIQSVSLLELFRDYYDRDSSLEILTRFLAAPIAIRTREKLRARMADGVSKS